MPIYIDFLFGWQRYCHWLMSIDADLCSLILIDFDWCWFVLIDSDWCWCWLKSRYPGSVVLWQCFLHLSSKTWGLAPTHPSINLNCTATSLWIPASIFEVKQVNTDLCCWETAVKLFFFSMLLEPGLKWVGFNSFDLLSPLVDSTIVPTNNVYTLGSSLDPGVYSWKSCQSRNYRFKVSSGS